MKKLLISVVAIFIAFISSSQVISLRFFKCQEIIKTESLSLDSLSYVTDTISNVTRACDFEYTFDLNQNTISKLFNGEIVRDDITVYTNIDNVITLVYTNNAAAGWVLDLNQNTVSYFEFKPDLVTRELIISNPILIKQ